MIRFEPDNDYPIDTKALPPHWLLVPVGDVFGDLRRGFYTGRHNDDGIGIGHLRPMNIGRDGRTSFDVVKYVDDRSDLRAHVDDVLFNNTNSAELVGKTAVLDRGGEWTFSNHLTRLRCPTGVSPRFTAYQFLYLWREGYFRKRSTQHVGQASINSQTLGETIPFALAPYGEQERIAAELNRCFSRLDAVQSLVHGALDRLRDYDKLVIKAAVAGTLVPTDTASSIGTTRPVAPIPNATNPRLVHLAAPDGDATAPPAGWDMVSVSDVGDVIAGRQRSPKDHGGRYMRPYLRVANVFEDRIDTSDVMEMNFTPKEYSTFLLEHGDILLNEGQSPELVGRPAMYRGEVPGACFTNTLLRFRAKPGVSAGFALLVFRSYLHTGRFRANARWTTNIAHLGLKRFCAMEFPLPDLANQERIVAETSRRLDLSQQIGLALRGILARTDQAWHLALQRAFHGKLVSEDVGGADAAALLEQIRHERRSHVPTPPIKKRQTGLSTSTKRKKARRPLAEILRSVGVAMTPEKLLAESGIAEDLIHEFYAELKREHLAERIVQTKDREGQVMLARGVAS